MISRIDDPVHLSDLKGFALSPAHFKASCESAFETTRAMRVGTIVHQMVLGARSNKPIHLFTGPKRQGKAWDSFVDEHRGHEIVTQPEWDDAEPIANAVMNSTEAMRWLQGRREIPLEWENGGIKCATGGIDVIGDGWLGDLKVTSCTEPSAWQRHAAKLMYHCQMTWYEDAAKAHGIDTSKGLVLIGVESRAPYNVTCMRLTPATIDQGRKSVSLWMEKLRIARENDFWPGYTQTTIDFDLPAWMGDDDGDASGDEGDDA